MTICGVGRFGLVRENSTLNQNPLEHQGRDHAVHLVMLRTAQKGSPLQDNSISSPLQLLLLYSTFNYLSDCRGFSLTHLGTLANWPEGLATRR